MGAAGSVIKEMQVEFSVKIKIPRENNEVRVVLLSVKILAN